MQLFLRPIAARLLKCPSFFGIVILMTFSSAQLILIVQSRIIYSIVCGPSSMVYVVVICLISQLVSLDVCWLCVLLAD